MKKYSLLILFFVYTQIFSQIGGISGSKIGAYCVDVVDHHNVEFEPGFFNIVSNSRWDSDGNLENIFSSPDSAIYNSGLIFRFTYGLWNRFEIGASLSSDLQKSNWGMRYIVYSGEKIGAALIAGANIPFGNKVIDNSVRLADNIASVGSGMVISSEFTGKLSLDFNAQYMVFTETTSENNSVSYYLNADLGYYLFNHQLQIIGGFGFRKSIFENFNSSVLTFYPGITVETGDNYIIVLSAPFDIYGENANKNRSVSLALTLTFQ